MSRSSNLKRHMALSVLIKGSGFVVSLVLMRVYVGFFDSSTVLGVWFTLLALLNWVVTFDFGVGNGLRNRLVQAIAKNDAVEQRALVSTTYTLSTLTAVTALVVGLLLVFILDWNAVLNVDNHLIASSSLEWAVFLVLVAVSAQLVLKNVNSVLFAMQMPSVSNGTGLATNLMLLLGMVFVRPVGDQMGVIVLSGLYLVCSTLPLVALSIWLFKGRMQHAAPRFRYSNRDTSKRVFRLGMGFFALQLMALAMFSSSELIIAQTVSPGSVVDYQLYNRLYNALASIVWIALVPMWSAVSEAYYVGDHEWIQRAFRKLSAYMPVVVLTLGLLTVFLQPLFNMWLGERAIQSNVWFGCAFWTYYSLYIWWGVLASFANGTGRIRTQLLCAVLGLVVYLVAAIGGALLSGRWIAVVWAGALGMLAYAIAEPLNIVRLKEESLG